MNWLNLLLCATALVAGGRIVAADTAEQDRINTAVEALTRLENVNLDEKPAIKAAVERVLARTHGTPAFVRLVQHFKLTNQETGLVEVAINHPADESGVQAMRLVLANKNTSFLEQRLAETNVASVARLAEVLGNTKEKLVVPLLQPLVTNGTHPLEVRRAAVRGLVQTREGANALLEFARNDQLPDNLKFLASSELNSVRWPDIKQKAARLLPLPAGQNAQPLPPVSELVRIKGDSARGAEVFQRETTGCAKCHQVRDEGRDVGPALTEIGSKLAKEALYEAVLDPSAGISFGYEPWQVQLKSGDETYGLKASETPEEVAIKDTNGIVTRYRKSEIDSMQQMKTSIMPSGLQQTMTTQELVDLIEYLASLKKASGSPP